MALTVRAEARDNISLNFPIFHLGLNKLENNRLDTRRPTSRTPRDWKHVKMNGTIVSSDCGLRWCLLIFSSLHSSISVVFHPSSPSLHVKNNESRRGESNEHAASCSGSSRQTTAFFLRVTLLFLAPKPKCARAVRASVCTQLLFVCNKIQTESKGRWRAFSYVRGVTGCS